MKEGDRIRIISEPERTFDTKFERLKGRTGTVSDPFGGGTSLIGVDVDDYQTVYFFKDEIEELPQLERKIDEVYSDGERR